MATKRTHFSCRRCQHSSQQRDDGHLPEFQTGGGRPAAECRQVILERTSDFSLPIRAHYLYTKLAIASINPVWLRACPRWDIKIDIKFIFSLV